MCGRYSYAPTKKQVQEQLKGLDTPAQFRLRYNIAPTQQALVILHEAPDQLTELTWGLVPRWSKDGANGGKLINARAETVAEKPSFQNAFRHRRCLVPADSFYEWRTEADRRKLPFRIRYKNGDLMFMAGIWEDWKQGDLHKRTFSIITSGANTDMNDLHDRMPVLLTTEEQRQEWLFGTPEDALQQLAKVTPDGLLEKYRVSEKLNTPYNEGPELHEPVPSDGALF